jgi:hypothetical protein
MTASQIMERIRAGLCPEVGEKGPCHNVLGHGGVCRVKEGKRTVWCWSPHWNDGKGWEPTAIWMQLTKNPPTLQTVKRLDS